MAKVGQDPPKIVFFTIFGRYAFIIEQKYGLLHVKSTVLMRYIL